MSFIFLPILRLDMKSKAEYIHSYIGEKGIKVVE